MTVNPQWLAAFHDECWYCSTSLTPATATIDHVIPTVRGGTWSAKNLAPACARCNKSKKDLTAAEFRVKKRFPPKEFPALTAFKYLPEPSRDKRWYGNQHYPRGFRSSKEFRAFTAVQDPAKSLCIPVELKEKFKDLTARVEMNRKPSANELEANRQKSALSHWLQIKFRGKSA